MGVRRVVPDLSSTSLEAAAKGFYGDVLGLRPVMDHGWIVTLAAPERPSVQISLMTHDATAPVIPDVSVQVDDVDACHAAAGTPHGSAARSGHWCRRGAARSHQSTVSASAVMRWRRSAMNSA